MKIVIDCRFMEVVRGENDYGWLNCNLRRTTTFSCPSCGEGRLVQRRA